MCNYNQLIYQVRHHVQALFKTGERPQLLYHNLNHTRYVASVAAQIANECKLKETNFFIVVAAAWFHDVGYLKQPNGHEVRSAKEAVDFLMSLQVSNAITDAVSQCILATRMPQQPTDLCQQILCDADLFQLGTDEFWQNNKLLHEEYEALQNTCISEEKWREKTISLMQAHQYHTAYCRQLLQAKKDENMVSLIAKQKEKSSPLDNE